jgi:hypothetical protein
MKLSEKQRLFTLMVARLIEFVYGTGLELTMGHVWRDTETQRRLVEQGLSKTMNSKHCDRLAVDLNLFVNGEYATEREAYRPLGELWERLGGRWGGRFGVDPKDYDKEVGWDPGHFGFGE